MPIQILFQDPLSFIAWIAAITISLTVHEYCHALSAFLLGDKTAQREGRLTLNPLAHIDWFGFITLVLVGIGWGKPVPFNPYNLKHQKWGPSIIAIAGPLSNLLMVGLSFGVIKILQIFTSLGSSNLLLQFLFLVVLVNIVLLLFNLIPLPPLDGSKLLFALLAAPKYLKIRYFLETRGPLILLFLIIADSFFGIHILSGMFNWVIFKIGLLI